jgi:DNA-binding response OmpR family regulator
VNHMSAVAEAIPLPPPLARSLSILVVDDDQALASIVSETLAEAGHSASVAIGGAAAVFQLVQDKAMDIDLVVADVRMPGIGGLALYEHVRACRPEMGPRFIFITGGGVNADTADVINDGGARLLRKPFTSTELLDAVDGAVDMLS